MQNFTGALPDGCKLGVLSTQPEVRKDFPRVKKFSILKTKASHVKTYQESSHGATFPFDYKFSDKYEINSYLTKV